MKAIQVLGPAVKYLTLILIVVWAFSIRLFSVVKYESVIHEFDPYFNYRVTQFLTKEGFYNLWNWFDDRTWYPLGRVVGGTVYPVCVFTAPLFSGLCALSAYGLVKEIRSEGAGLLAAAFVAAVPSYISRSVAGSFDNEGVAIFALVNVFYLFVKTLNTGSLYYATLLITSYFYMVLSWGGYSFIINLLPIFCLVCIFFGRLNGRLYVAFAPLVAVGTLMSASVPVVGFNAILMSEHFGAFLAFAVLHVALLVSWIRSKLSRKHFTIVCVSSLAVAGTAGAVAIAAVAGYVLQSPTLGWTGRSLSLLDPTYAGRFIPIIASVSEHQPPSWTSYIQDLHILILLAPAGLMACFVRFNDATLFLILYGITAVYFSGVMVRLMLVLAPACCCLAAVALSDLLAVLCTSLKNTPPPLPSAQHKSRAGLLASLASDDTSSVVSDGGVASVGAARDVSSSSADSAVLTPAGKKSKSKGQGAAGGTPKREKEAAAAAVAPKEAVGSSRTSQQPWYGNWESRYPLPPVVCVAALAVVASMLALYVVHCVHASADMYSSPSIVLQTPRAASLCMSASSASPVTATAASLASRACRVTSSWPSATLPVNQVARHGPYGPRSRPQTQRPARRECATHRNLSLWPQSMLARAADATRARVGVCGSPQPFAPQQSSVSILPRHRARQSRLSFTLVRSAILRLQEPATAAQLPSASPVRGHRREGKPCDPALCGSPITDNSPRVTQWRPESGAGGGIHVFDDFREAYGWLRHNTHPDAKVASWWDYGYQTTAMANRTVIVDNNTWNTTHIATVGRAMSSPEAKAWQIYRSLDVDYVFVVFGGLIGYPSDDINKFLWMVRIGGGVYPEIKEPDFLAGGTDYRIDAQGTKTMLNTLMYKLSYLDFAEASERSIGTRGMDRVRNTVIGKLSVKLRYFEEVFTSEHWMMRIYRVRDRPLRDGAKGPKERKGKARRQASA
ncbi:MAG: hypothetical protein WDW38_007532 [Sanguina aurantia]